MKITHLRSSGGLYGAEQVILNLAMELNKLECVNSVLSMNHMQNSEQLALVKEAQKQGLEAIYVRCSGLIDHKAIGEIRQFLIQHKIDVLHCHDYKACFFGLLAARGLKVKKVATNHLWTHASFKLRLYETIEGLLYNAFDTVVAVSERIQEESKRLVFNKKKIHFIPNGIDVERFYLEEKGAARAKLCTEFGLPENAILIGNMARLSVEKDHALLLKAFKELLNQAPDNNRYYLLIAGAGEEEKNLKQLAIVLKIDQQCLFLGVRSDVPELLNSFDIYVQSSTREGLPMVILEAMAAGTVIVTTKAGGIPKVITDKETGRLVEIGNQEELTSILKEVLQNKNKAQLMSQAALKLVKDQYSSKAMAEKYLKTYRFVKNLGNK